MEGTWLVARERPHGGHTCLCVESRDTMHVFLKVEYANYKCNNNFPCD